MNIIGRRNLWFLISGLIIIPGIIAWILWGLNLGIDFKGGTLYEFELIDKTKTVDSAQIKEVLKEKNLQDLSVTPTGQGSYLVRFGPTEDSNKTKEEINSAIKEKIGESQEIRYETIGPTVSRDLTHKAFWAIVLASFFIIIYLAWSFRTVPKPVSSWRFGVCAIIALIHDLLVVVGIAAILGHFINLEIDSLFITALLTIMGFSVHDSIVVFDRIRENLRRHPTFDFEQVVNASIVQTLNRSLNTSLTVILTLLALCLLGGASIKHFVLILIIGITIGTYSSIFTASPLLVVWQKIIARRSQGR